MNQPIALRELPITLKSEGRPLQSAIRDALRSAMQEGRLRPGARLPSSRDLARQLRVARGTVVLAYEQLRAEGYLEGTHGAGTTVVESLPERWFMPSRASLRRPRRRAVSFSQSEVNTSPARLFRLIGYRRLGHFVRTHPQ